MKRLWIYAVIFAVSLTTVNAFAYEVDMGDHIIYTVERGDKGVTFIAAKYGVNPDNIGKLNPWLTKKGRSINQLYPGEKLIIIPPRIQERLEREMEEKYRDEIKSTISQIDQEIDETKVAAKQTKAFTEKIMPYVVSAEELGRQVRKNRRAIYNVVLSVVAAVLLLLLFVHRKKNQNKRFENAYKTEPFDIGERKYIYVPEKVGTQYKSPYKGSLIRDTVKLRRSIISAFKKYPNLIKKELKAKRLIEVK